MIVSRTFVSYHKELPVRTRLIDFAVVFPTLVQDQPSLWMNQGKRQIEQAVKRRQRARYDDVREPFFIGIDILDPPGENLGGERQFADRRTQKGAFSPVGLTKNDLPIRTGKRYGQGQTRKAAAAAKIEYPCRPDGQER